MRNPRRKFVSKRTKKQNLNKYGFEFFSMFIAIIAAFALNNWNDNRKENHSENNILTEISNGLKKDLLDVKANKEGHVNGISSVKYFKRVLNEQPVGQDSLKRHYFNLTRDFVSIQNVAGYETLKSQGLEVIKNDSLRHQIISLYEYDYKALLKLEEEYPELQFQENYFNEINLAFAPSLNFDKNGEIVGIANRLNLAKNKKQELQVLLWKMQFNRNFILNFYNDVEVKIKKTIENIDLELSKK